MDCLYQHHKFSSLLRKAFGCHLQPDASHDDSDMKEFGLLAGGRQDNHHAAAIERALTQRDEFGNIMTPKERFRNLCYKYAACPCLTLSGDIGSILKAPSSCAAGICSMLPSM